MGTLFLDYTTGMYPFLRETTKTRKVVAYLLVNKVNFKGFDFEGYKHLPVLGNFYDRLSKKWKPQLKPADPGYITLSFHSLTKTIWCLNKFTTNKIQRFVIYFKKDNPYSPIILAIVSKSTGSEIKDYYVLNDIFQNVGDINDISILKKIGDSDLKSTLEEEIRKHTVTFDIHKTPSSYSTIQVSGPKYAYGSSTFKYYTHTASSKYIIFTKFQCGDNCVLPQGADLPENQGNLPEVNVYFFTNDNSNHVPLLIHLNHKSGHNLGGNPIYYELCKVNDHGYQKDISKWTKEYKKAIITDTLGNKIAEKLDTIYNEFVKPKTEELFIANKTPEIAGGVTTAVLGAGGVAGGVLYFKYPHLIVSLISKLAGK